MKRSGLSDQSQPTFNKRAQTQNGSSASKVKLEKGGSSQGGNPTCATCGKKHYGECLVGTRNCFSCAKDGDKVRDCPTIVPIGKESKHVSPSAPKEEAPINRHFYELWARGSKPDENYSGDDVGKLSFLLSSNMSSY